MANAPAEGMHYGATGNANTTNKGKLSWLPRILLRAGVASAILIPFTLEYFISHFFTEGRCNVTTWDLPQNTKKIAFPSFTSS